MRLVVQSERNKDERKTVETAIKSADLLMEKDKVRCYIIVFFNIVRSLRHYILSIEAL